MILVLVDVPEKEFSSKKVLTSSFSRLMCPQKMNEIICFHFFMFIYSVIRNFCYPQSGHSNGIGYTLFAKVVLKNKKRGNISLNLTLKLHETLKLKIMNSL